ncbi:putative kinase [Pseudonocardia dioxanivorans CB1190]|uniref:Kinase n=1 Tax=Pseudonocardia dioxanivorans (strain ATCC 55486 / DSM 44775 / JCM 13855 / CB1190) TaxID=675635 RepID=F4CSH9_PSEUX|nr:kinase [Pseudonocardia dioxanivorans]AEA23384.1 putative kinase [Pseudonocardia dioxanivorans CB1190]
MASTSLGVILYGPPASGKDTVTGALRRLNPRYELFRRLKVGGGRTAGYRLTDQATIDALREQGEIIWENQRYDALYAIDRQTLVEYLDRGVPVVHAGQPEVIDAVVAAIPGAHWLVVALSCPREVAEQRIIARATGDTTERLWLWDRTPVLMQPVVAIDTSLYCPDAAAELINGQATVHVAKAR